MTTTDLDLRIRRKNQVDMSPEAIARRLERLDQLFRLGQSLRGARRISPAEAGAEHDEGETQ